MTEFICVDTDGICGIGVSLDAAYAQYRDNAQVNIGSGTELDDVTFYELGRIVSVEMKLVEKCVVTEKGKK